VQTRQAGAVLASTILGISEPLSTALQIETATGGEPEQLPGSCRHTPAGHLFVSRRCGNSRPCRHKSLPLSGVAPALAPASNAASAFIEAALRARTFVVTSVNAGGLQRIAYAIADPQSPKFVVYAERAIPANRQVAVESNPAFSDLDYATYIGPTVWTLRFGYHRRPRQPAPPQGRHGPGRHPVRRHHAHPGLRSKRSSGRRAGRQSALDFPGGRELVTMATAVAAGRLVRRRREAERDAQTISGLYERLDELYGEQRTIAETFAGALLPAYNPAIPNLEIASR